MKHKEENKRQTSQRNAVQRQQEEESTGQRQPKENGCDHHCHPCLSIFLASSVCLLPLRFFSSEFDSSVAALLTMRANAEDHGKTEGLNQREIIHFTTKWNGGNRR